MVLRSWLEEQEQSQGVVRHHRRWAQGMCTATVVEAVGTEALWTRTAQAVVVAVAGVELGPASVPSTMGTLVVRVMCTVVAVGAVVVWGSTVAAVERIPHSQQRCLDV